MHGLIAWYRERTRLEANGPIPALFGLRALLVFSIYAYHLWQQSWLAPALPLVSTHISSDPFLRTGYLWVDGLLLLSAFLLSLPYLRAREAGRKAPGFAGFYKRRLARILPSYLLNLLLVFFLVALKEGHYATWWEGIRDWLAHLSFTHPLFDFSNLGTPLNGAAWTLGIQVQFYLLFPLLMRGYRRSPLLMVLCCYALAFSFRAFAISRGSHPMLINQLPAFMDVFANGMLAAAVYARLEKRLADDLLMRGLMSALLLAALMGLAVLVRAQASLRGLEAERSHQLSIRFVQSLLLCLVFLGASRGLGGLRLLLGSRVAWFLATISYQVYLWHQVVNLRLIAWGIPVASGPNPHMRGELRWQWGYIGLSLLITLLLSTLLAFAFERPLARRLSGRGTR